MDPWHEARDTLAPEVRRARVACAETLIDSLSPEMRDSCDIPAHLALLADCWAAGADFDGPADQPRTIHTRLGASVQVRGLCRGLGGSWGTTHGP